MKIKRLQLKDFMLFQNLDIPFSPHVNIISGENSTGKTALIKLLYSCMKGLLDKRKDRNYAGQQIPGCVSSG